MALRMLSLRLTHPVHNTDHGIGSRQRFLALSIRAESSQKAGLATAVAKRQLQLRMSVKNIPHPEKAHYGGEDAFFAISVGGGAMGVADGVGGWNDSGISPAEYSRTFMETARKYLEGQVDKDGEPISTNLSTSEWMDARSLGDGAAGASAFSSGSGSISYDAVAFELDEAAVKEREAPQAMPAAAPASSGSNGASAKSASSSSANGSNGATSSSMSSSSSSASGSSTSTSSSRAAQDHQQQQQQQGQQQQAEKADASQQQEAVVAALQEQMAEEEERRRQRDLLVRTPLEALDVAHKTTRLPGSATACVLRLDGERGILTAANVGDSGFLLVRNGKLYFQSPVLQHFFDCPYQFGAHPEYAEATDSVQDADVFDFEVQPGDVIILATDGLLDNCYAEEIVELAPTSPDHVDKAADALARLASEHANDPEFESPYTEEAVQEGLDIPIWEKLFSASFDDGKIKLGKLKGGKLDDITVLVGYVEAVGGSP